MKWRNKKVGLTLLISIILLSSLLSYQLGLSSVPASGPYYLDVPFGTASYYVGKFDNGTTYMVDGDTWQCVWWSTDSSVVINAALGNLTSGRTWKEKVISVGNFTLTDSINILNYTIFEIQGKLTVESSTNINAIEINGNTNIDVFGGEIDGNKASNTDVADRELQNGIFIGGVSTNILIRGVTIRNTVRDGIRIGNTTSQHTGPQYVTVTECNVIDCGLTGVALDGDGIKGWGAIRCIVSENNVIGSNLHGIIFIGSEEIIIEENHSMDSVTTDGICLYNCDHVTIDGNVCGDNYNYGIVISIAASSMQGDISSWVTISDNVIYDTGVNDGIYLWGNATLIHEHITISGNTIKDTANNGIATNYANEITIVGNTIEGCGIGIILSYTSFSTVTGNFVSETTSIGIQITNSPQTTITGCTVKNATGQGINLVNNSHNFTISGVNVADCTESNILIDGCNNGTITSSLSTGSAKHGIQISNALNIVVVGCRSGGNGWNGVSEGGTADYTLLDGCNLRGNTTPHDVNAGNSVVGDVIT